MSNKKRNGTVCPKCEATLGAGEMQMTSDPMMVKCCWCNHVGPIVAFLGINIGELAARARRNTTY